MEINETMGQKHTPIPTDKQTFIELAKQIQKIVAGEQTPTNAA